MGEERREPITDDSEPLALGSALFPSGLINSFAWAAWRGVQGPTALKGKIIVGPNSETWQNARDYEFAALISASRVTREENMAHMLYALGHVLHVNQDLSQPDHVRNDNHYSRKWGENYGIDKYYNQPGAFPLRPRGWPSWRNAGFVRLQEFWDRNLYVGGAAALNNDATGTPGCELGLAEFTNGNFLGEDAVYREYFPVGHMHSFAYPSLWTSTTFPLVAATPGAGAGVTYLRNEVSGTRLYLGKVADGIVVRNHSVLTHTGTLFPKRASTKVTGLNFLDH